MRLFKKLRRKLDYLTEAQVDQIHQAFLMALDAHREQKRQSGEPYITHPVAVACILAEVRMDAQSIMAALLHDVLEDTEVTKEQMTQAFGEDVTNLVDGVSKLTQFEFRSAMEKQAENFVKMVLAMSQDIRVIIIKLADRLHNMRTLDAMPQHKKRRIAKETLEIYAPIARRLGMREFSVELEELGFHAYQPMRYKALNDAVTKARGHRKRVLARIDKALHEAISDSQIEHAKITGREKHLYSIYRKMLEKNLKFSDVMDVYAFRIVADSRDACYRVLGLVHGLYRPVLERFKDYIAIPKSNGYQSIHTTLFGPYGLPIEIQIRTTDMDRMATNGIAAHWLYKETAKPNRSQQRAKHWVNNLLELKEQSGNSLEFLENVKVDLFPDEVYVFTPKGEIRALPAGATAVDFAYAVHTDVGNTCVAAKVNRQLTPLSTPLASGQSVEIMTDKHARPNPAWLDFVVTSKARSCIRHFLINRKHVDSVKLGKQLLASALAHDRLALKNISEELWQEILTNFDLDSVDDLYAQIGLGDRIGVIVAQQIQQWFAEHKNMAQEIEQHHVNNEPLAIRGTEGMMVKYATCCHPIPGDPIVGVLTSGYGVNVHMASCASLKRFAKTPEKVTTLRWAEDENADFSVVILVQVANARGVLAKIAMVISSAEADIEDIDVEDKDGRYFNVLIELQVKNRVHLARIMRKIRTLNEVVKIQRKK